MKPSKQFSEDANSFIEQIEHNCNLAIVLHNNGIVFDPLGS